MPMSSKKLLHGGLELCPCQARNGYMDRTMPMSSKKWLHGGLELCPCQARSGYMEV